MIKRASWFAAGAAAGAVGAVAVSRKVKQAGQQLRPVNVARSAGARVKARGADVVAAVREGRAHARSREAELKAARDGKAQAMIPGLTAPAPPGTTVNVVVVDAADVPGLSEAIGDLRASSRGPRRAARRPR